MIPPRLRPLPALGAVLLALGAAPLGAQPVDVPYWASLDAPEINLRAGPSANYPIRWVYVREGLPVKVLRVNQGWRYVEDIDGERGWMAAALLSRRRAVIVIGEGAAPLRAEPEPTAPLRWQVEPGVTAYLGECENGWCEIDISGHAGWMEAERLWGDEAP